MKQKFLRFVSKSAMFTASFGLVFSSLAPMAANAAQISFITDQVSRLKTSTTADHIILFQTSAAWSSSTNNEIIISFPSDFALSATSTWDVDEFLISEGTTSSVGTDVDLVTGTGTVATASTGTALPSYSCGTSVAAVALNTNSRKFGFKRCTGTGVASGFWIRFTLYGGTAADTGSGTGALGGTLTNATSTGNKLVDLTYGTAPEATVVDSGTYALSMVSADTISASSTVITPTLTFTSAGQTSTTNCASNAATQSATASTVSIPGSASTVPLSFKQINTSSDVICTHLKVQSASTATGTVGSVYIESFNGALTTNSFTVGSTSPVTCTGNTCIPDTAITAAPSSTTPTIGTNESYGFCMDSAAGSNNATATSPFNSTCTQAASSTTYGQASKSQAQAWAITTGTNANNTTGASGYASIRIKAAIIDSTPAGAYTDTVFLVGVGQF